MRHVLIAAAALAFVAAPALAQNVDSKPNNPVTTPSAEAGANIDLKAKGPDGKNSATTSGKTDSETEAKAPGAKEDRDHRDGAGASLGQQAPVDQWTVQPGGSRR
jgi:hypothetical protein